MELFVAHLHIVVLNGYLFYYCSAAVSAADALSADEIRPKYGDNQKSKMTL